tara:strand:- start:158 stop:367 length:210 start_codon:yes stop_codon:yes gene_type:complete
MALNFYAVGSASCKESTISCFSPLRLGPARNFVAQHGHLVPSQWMKRSQFWQRFWPAKYLMPPIGFFAL